MNAPGSPSSPLHSTYLGSPVALAQERHLRPVENPPPPRPRRPAASTTPITSAGVMVVSACASAAKPPMARYSSRLSGSITPQLASAIRVWSR